MADEEPEEEQELEGEEEKEINEEEGEVEEEEEEEKEKEKDEEEEEEVGVKKRRKSRPGKRFFDEVYGEEYGGEGMDFFPPPSDFDLLMISESKLMQETVEEKAAHDAEEEAELEEKTVEEEEEEEEKEREMKLEVEVEEEEEKEKPKAELKSEKPSLTTLGSLEYDTQISEYLVRPKEKTPSEIQFETDYREVIEERMKKIMQPVAEEKVEKKAPEREPVQKKKLLITDVDVSGLYPQPKAIESEISFAFDEDEEDKGVSEVQREADITQHIMDVVKDSLMHDPESIFTKNLKDEIQKVREVVQETVRAVRKGVQVDIGAKVNETLSAHKPNLRNTLIIRLKEKLEKGDTLVKAEEEEEEKPEEEEKKSTLKKKPKVHKKEEETKEGVEIEKVTEVSVEKPKEGKPVEITPKLRMKEEKEEEERVEMVKEKETEEEIEQEIEEKEVIPYEKIDWLQYLTESERQLAVDMTLQTEMEDFIRARKAQLDGQQKEMALKKERREKYRKTKDPLEKLRNLNLVVTMKFVLNSGNMFTCAYRYFMTFKEIKQELSAVFKVPPDVLIIYRDDVEVKDDETTYDLRPEIEPFESVTFRLLTLDNDRWVLKSDHLELPVPDIMTFTVETGKDYLGVPEYKEVVVEIENRKIKKPFVGGYRDCKTGVEYHHAFSQSAPHPPKLPWEKRVSRDTQTFLTDEKLIDTTNDKATQMHRRDYYVSTESDVIITAKPYVDYDTWYKRRDIEGKVKTIQRYLRAMILRRFLKKMSQEYRQRKCWEIEQEKKRILERENRIKMDIINMTYPKTKADFDMLYALVEKWRKAQVERISNLKTEAPKKAELCTVLEKEIKLLEAIEVHRIAISKQKKQLKALNFMKKVAQPVTWTGYRGITIKMDTMKTQRARELKELYQSLCRHELNYQDRIELLVSLKYALRVNPTRVAEELSNLINQECEMLIRGVKPKHLENLRHRIEHLFGECFKDPNLNPEAAKHDPVLNKEPLKNNILFCKLCHQMKLLQDFSATARDRSINVCSACQWLHNIAIPRIDLNPYRYILKAVRKDEQKRNCYSSCAFVLQDEDMRFLVANIWRNRSAVSENENLLDLRMPRWNVNEDWTPWNCILLTELEAKAHLKTKPEDNYEPQLIGEIVTKHEIAKRQFQQLISTVKRLRDSGKWANVVDVREYKQLSSTADIPDMPPEEGFKRREHCINFTKPVKKTVATSSTHNI